MFSGYTLRLENRASSKQRKNKVRVYYFLRDETISIIFASAIEESNLTSKDEFNEILKILKKRYGLMDMPLHVSDVDPFRVLIGAVLSHRTRDEKTDEAYDRLFKKFKNGSELARADVRSITKLIKPAGFYREKARRIKKIAQIIYGEYGGRVPDSRDELLKLPGVGPKTADIVLSVAFGKPEIAVDTHVEAVAKRLGVAGEKAGYEEVKQALTRLVSVNDAFVVNMLFVRFGREICRRPKPKCEVCPITIYCRYYAEKIKGRVA